MNKLSYLLLSSLLLVAGGISIFFTEDVGLETTKAIISLFFIAAGVLSLIFAVSNKKVQIPFYFQLIQGIGLIMYAIVIWFLATDKGQFLTTTTYFILIYGFIEISFPFSVLNSSTKVIFRPMIFRIVSGLITALGALFLLLATREDELMGIWVLGSLTCLIGISNLFFTRKMKGISPENFNEEK